MQGRGFETLEWEILGVEDYVEYRRSLYGEINHKALLVDAVGTLVVPSQPMAQVFPVSFLVLHFQTYIYLHIKKRMYNMYSIYGFLDHLSLLV